ncbi:MAG: hypothetical protein JNK67_22630 [Alphaproteobacteria bacterium]|nr:hypothetical protein [Alphaproteobacteria bacterium]
MSKALDEFRFLATGDLDRLAALVFELSSQLHVERHKRMALEKALLARGVLAEADIAGLADDPAFLATARDEADRSLRKMMRVLAEDGDRRTPLRNEAL